MRTTVDIKLSVAGYVSIEDVVVHGEWSSTQQAPIFVVLGVENSDYQLEAFKDDFSNFVQNVVDNDPVIQAQLWSAWLESDEWRAMNEAA